MDRRRLQVNPDIEHKVLTSLGEFVREDLPNEAFLLDDLDDRRAKGSNATEDERKHLLLRNTEFRNCRYE